MIKQIVHHSARLIEFIVLLQLNLSKPQYRHVLHIADAAIVCESPHKTLTTLYDLIVDAPHPSNAADCLRISPWAADELREPLRTFTIDDLMQAAEMERGEVLYVSIDDSITEKDKGTTCLEAVDWHHDHTKSVGKKQAYTNGTQHIEVRLQLGNQAYVYDWGLYLREKTVRRLNRKRSKEQRLSFRTKYRIVRSPRLSKRTGTEIDRPTFELYEAGRLYRFGTSVKPFLNRFTQAEQVGHYFIDIKDFTRQTSMLKEDVMADFIRREFYEPILAIASEHYHGLPQLADRGGIYLNNLLGDAVSLSGDIVSLVKTSRKDSCTLGSLCTKLTGSTGKRGARRRCSSHGRAQTVSGQFYLLWPIGGCAYL